MEVPDVTVPVVVGRGKTHIYEDETVDIFITEEQDEVGLELYIDHSDAPEITPQITNADCEFCSEDTEKTTVMCLDEKYARLFSKTMLRLQSTHHLQRVNSQSVLGRCVFCEGQEEGQICFSESFVPWD